MDQRYSRVEWGAGKPRKRTSEANWQKPITWNKKAAKTGKRLRIFCASLADVFDKEVRQEWRDDLWQLIEQTPNLDWLLLTKRPASIRGMVSWDKTWPENVWLGTSVENEQFARSRLPILLDIPAKIRFISAEPLLSDFTIPAGINWVITGGESGKGWRDINADHARSLRDQCIRLRIPFFFKQWSGQNPKKLGRELDGREWNQTPYTYEGLMNDFPKIEERKIYEHNGQEYVKISKAEGFQNPDAIRFKLGDKVCWFVPRKAA